MSDVRPVATTFVAKKLLNMLLYAPSTSATVPRSARPGFSTVCRSSATTSSAVKNSRPACWSGRSRGVCVLLFQMPCRYGAVVNSVETTDEYSNPSRRMTHVRAAVRLPGSERKWST